MHLSIRKLRLTLCRNAEDANTGGSGLLIAPPEINSSGCSSSSTETSNASSSSTVPARNSYEVFLSFRGLDTRNNFTDHLYNGLLIAGIHAFRDSEKLHQGKEIGPNLLAAIKSSKILIPILSENYGGSSWCLDELIQIMECKNNDTGTLVLPIFYKVAPVDVRHQIGKFGKAFGDRERRLRARGFDPAILEKWKQALKEVGNLKGQEATGSEAELVKSVVQQVLFELKKKFELVIPANLVGIDNHVKKVMQYVDKNSHATLFVGIHGMGGIGKTTLAKTIYNKLSNQFEYRSFIADVRESWKRNGIHYLQNQLLNDILKQENLARDEDEGINFLSSRLKGKKVLILLDDVDNDDQLKALAGNHNWFSPGSVIFITTRDESILERAYVDYKHGHQELDEDTSLILFSRHAFQRDAPPSEFKKLTDEVLSTTGGLPLSLEVLGSFFCRKKETQWRGTIDKLKKVPHKKVQEKLRISYEALENGQKQIFLDIACFFIGTNWRTASYMWDACGFYPKEGIEVLRFMSLIKIGENDELTMHDQLRDLGRLIVREGNEDKPQDCSRLWDSKEVLKMLEENEGTAKIEAIYLTKDSSKGFGKTTNQSDNILMGKQFEKLRNLRFLDMSGAYFSGDFKNSMRKLKWLQWNKCPLTFEANNFHLKELRVLKLRCSEISDKWQGWNSIMMAKKLKYLDLALCGPIKRTFFLSAFENLEVLILGGCWCLEQIDLSIGNMKSLVHLDLSGCHGLKRLPAEVGKLEALEQLLLTYSGVEQLPDSIGDLRNLQILDIRGTRVIELPNGIGRLGKLRDLDASYCYALGGNLPESIRNCSSLQCLNLYYCKNLQSLSMLPSSLTYLTVSCQSRRLPFLSNLTHLKELRLFYCEFLECISENPSILSENSLNTPFELEILEIHGCVCMETLEVSQFNRLRTLSAVDCSRILEIQGLDKLKYLESLEIRACASIKRLDLPKSESLKILSAENCKNLVEIQCLNRLFLTKLCITNCTLIERLDLSKYEGLQILVASYCKNLVEIQGLNSLRSLKMINISGCVSIKKLDLPKSKNMRTLNAQYCKSLVEIQGLNKLEFLNVLNMSGCISFGRLADLCCFDTLHELAINCCSLHDIQSLERFSSCISLWIEDFKSSDKFPNLSNFYNLQKLFVSNCHEIREIPGFEESTSLELIAISSCSSIKILPDLSACTNLISLVMQNCEKLTKLQGLEKLEQLVELDISGCKSLETIPELSGTRIYRNYERDSWAYMTQ